MAYVGPITAGAVVIGGAVTSMAVKYFMEEHPLVRAERCCWAKDHALEVDQAKQAALHALVSEHFQLGSQLELCFTVLSAAGDMMLSAASDMMQYENW